MKKLKTIFLALNLFLGAILCLGNSTIKTVNDGVPITITKTSFNSGYDRSSSISAHISGHYLNVAFLADIGSATIKILDESYTMLELSYIETPSGYQYYIPLEGRYTLLIALEDGDEYRGDFEVGE